MKTAVSTDDREPIRRARLAWIAETLRNRLRCPVRITVFK